MAPVFGLILLAVVSAAGVQQPFSAPLYPEAGSNNHYQFDRLIRKVAIVGAGPSGLLAFHELTEAGLDARIFERDSAPGGNWHYTEEIPFDSPVPNVAAAIGDFIPSLPPANVGLPYSEEFEDNDGEIRRDHRGPKPIWESLTSNTPTLLQEFMQWRWPAGTPWELTQYQLRNYVRSYASYRNINSNDDNPATSYNTRVELIEKRIDENGQEQGWRLWLKSLELTGGTTCRATWWTEDFDAVVVASGKYSASFMPNIPGLEEWIKRFPQFIRHGRQYRRPEAYTNQTVLIVGASISGSEIARDLNNQARKVYISYRDNNDTLHYSLGNPRHRIPQNTTQIGEINQFFPLPDRSPIQSGFIELKNGTIISGIDRVIFATGFRYSFPFLPQYYDGATYEPHDGSAPKVSPFLPVDGSHIRDLYLDQFYIQDPTLAFLGMPKGVHAFPLTDYVTLALAKVWTNTAKLPDKQTMQAWHEKTVDERGGYGKHVMWWGEETFGATVRYIVGWLNEGAVMYGGKQVDPLPTYFEEIRQYWVAARF